MEWIRQVMAVGGVLVLLAVSLWWLRRKGVARFGARGPRARALQSVERIPLGPQHSLHLVRLAGRGMLVGVSPAGCALLESFEWTAVESAAPAAVAEPR